MRGLKNQWIDSGSIKDCIYIPKYYDSDIQEELESLTNSHEIISIQQLVDEEWISLSVGHEIGKAAYGTGDIPFVRTSDIVNWEIKASPKQGVSNDIFEKYAAKQRVEPGDILFVRDGTYLIGRNGFVTEVDQKVIMQSHVLKIKVMRPEKLAPELLFLAINSPIVQRQIRAKQFTADIIDTIGGRFLEVKLPIPRDPISRQQATSKCKELLAARTAGKLFVKQFPSIAERALEKGSFEDVKRFQELSIHDQISELRGYSVTSEFGGFVANWISSSDIAGSTYIPKFYDPSIQNELKELRKTCDLVSIGELQERGQITINTGVEPGKMAYGTGDIPFVRTSDFSNWEIASMPKQGVSEEVYRKFQKGAVTPGDVLLVRDGTYLVGSSCVVTELNPRALISGGVIRLRPVGDDMGSFLLLGLLNTFIVKRQLRARQFTRDVIDTLGNRFLDVSLPIPKSKMLQADLAQTIAEIVESRVRARNGIKQLAEELTQ